MMFKKKKDEGLLWEGWLQGHAHLLWEGVVVPLLWEVAACPPLFCRIGVAALPPPPIADRGGRMAILSQRRWGDCRITLSKNRVVAVLPPPSNRHPHGHAPPTVEGWPLQQTLLEHDVHI